MVERHQGLARALANRLARRPEDREDVLQVAMLGLLKAVDRYDPDRGVEFTTFAWATIQGEIKRHYRDVASTMRVHRRLQEHYLRICAAEEELRHALGRSPTIAELAVHAGMAEEDVVEGIEVRRAYRPVALETSAAGEGRPGLEMGVEDQSLDRVEQRAVLTPLVKRLPAREQRILELRFVDDLLQSEIAAIIGISQMHVSRLLANSLSRLREWSAEAGGEPGADTPGP
jgi:RNA polymerase sigma-B factor